MFSSASRSKTQNPPSDSKWAPEKIGRIARDIKNAPKINLLSLLTAFLARMLKGDGDIDDSDSHSMNIKCSESIINAMHRDAVAFCKDKSNTRATEMKKHLGKYLRERKEKGRRTALCNALNTALAEFRDKRYGDLPLPSQRFDKDELIFITYDLTGLESEHIEQHMPTSKRSPDLLAISTSTLRKYYSHHNEAGFEEWLRFIKGGHLLGSPGPSEKLQWTETLQAWELSATSLIDMNDADKDRVETQTTLHSYNLRTRSDSRQRQNSRKRRSEEGQSGKSKKARVDSKQEPQLPHLLLTDGQLNLAPEIRCAYYGVERLASAWNIKHSTSVLLKATGLSLCWYDAQGCFKSEEIDIMDQMPLFVVFISILQRFDKQMWGLFSEDAHSVMLDDNAFKLGRSAQCGFELIGRHTFGSPAARISPELEDEMKMFFKSSWVKCRDSKEPDIIKTAHERANLLIPENYREMVTGHIPSVDASWICTKESTFTVRQLIVDVDNTVRFTEENEHENARHHVWLMTQRLEPIHTLDPPEFWKAFWETVRCHYLLWKIGIAHRDISISNLMCSRRNGQLFGVLNDYDLAIVMKPGSRYPMSDGNERGGTTPFMAVDMFDYRDAKMTRYYRHDLESFAWCLCWEMLESPPRSWSEGSADAIFDSKRATIYVADNLLPQIKEKWLPSFLFILTWFDNWRMYLKGIDRIVANSYIASRKPQSESDKVALRNGEDERKADRDHIQLAMEAAKAVSYSENVDALQNVSWISLELLSKSST